MTLISIINVNGIKEWFDPLAVTAVRERRDAFAATIISLAGNSFVDTNDSIDDVANRINKLLND